MTITFEEKVKKLKEFVKEKNLQHFLHWTDKKNLVLVKETHLISVLEKQIKQNLDKYVGKKLAQVLVAVNLRGLEDKSTYILGIKIIICKVEKYGKIEDLYGLNINFSENELKKINFSLKFVKELIDLTKDKKFISDTLFGIDFDKMLTKLKKNKIDISPFVKNEYI